ncbi:MAG: PQQ-binding-like beta-propeller repeat protein, partial [Fervidobacterium sp.]
NSPAYASPVIGAGRVFVVSGKGRVYAFDFNDFKSLFEIDLPLPSGSECKGTPAFSDGVLYVPTRTVNGKGEIFAINAYTGEIIWRSGPIGNFTSSPAVNDKFIFIGSEESTFFAISKADGKVKWKYGTKSRIISSPAVTGDYVVFASTDGFIYAADMSGNIVWQISSGGEIITSPAVGYNKLIITFGNTCLAFSDSIDFSVSADPANFSLYQGEEANIKIRVLSTSSLAQNVFLRADKVPLGFEIVISPNILKLTSTSAEANLKLLVNKTVKEGTYSFDIIGETTGRTRKAKVVVEVLKISEGTFTIDVTPANASVKAGNAVVFMVSLSSNNGFIGVVNLSILNAPNGFTCSFTEPRIEVPGITSLSVLVDITMDPDKYSVAIQGKGGGRTEITRISVSVEGTKRYDWPGFGNLDRITNCTEEGVASSLELRYTFQAEGAIRSQPSIVKDTAFFTTEIQRATKHHATKLYAIDVKTGKLKWDYFLGISPTTLPDIGTETKDDPPPWISSPRVYGNKLFVGTLDGLLFCFDVNTGKPIWYRNVGSSIRSSPCVGDGKVYFGTSNNKVYALDIESGEQRWMTELKGPIYSSPAFYKGRVYVS